ncbi:MAG: MaoC family dehydratase N-terminal domain-containing protein [Nocardioides sp.]|nr:MaoC family dehydratase N-terminal domain-containing protein [Nocardioides sp.]
MSLDPSIVGRRYPTTAPYTVSTEKVREFARAVGTPYDGPEGPVSQVPATFPIVLAFAAMNGFLEAEEVDLSRIVHGEQSFTYERPVAPGDVLTARLTISSVRSLGGADVVATSSAITDPDGGLVCTATATLVHRGEAA